MNQYGNEDRRKSERRVSPAVAEFALEERCELLERIAELEANYNEACDDAMCVARELSAMKEQQRGGVVLSSSRAGRVYIAGPMTGYDNYNFAAFNAEADRLRAKGLHVENPADHGVLDGAEWSDYLRYDISRLATCERIHLLPGWSKSKGARLEVSIAQSLGAGIDYAEGAEVISQPGECVAGDERAAFEEWASRKYPNASRRDALGAFSRDLKKSAKEGWQARSALAGSKEGE